MNFITAKFTLQNFKHTSITRIYNKKYEIFYKIESCKVDPKSKDFYIQIRFDNQIVGSAHIVDEDNKYIYPQNIEVEEKHRRGGLGTAMYVFAEYFFKKKLYRLWDSTEQTEDSQNLWNQPNRPFGLNE